MAEWDGVKAVWMVVAVVVAVVVKIGMAPEVVEGVENPGGSEVEVQLGVGMLTSSGRMGSM